MTNRHLFLWPLLCLVPALLLRNQPDPDAVARGQGAMPLPEDAEAALAQAGVPTKGLALELKPARQLAFDGEPRLTLTLVNRGPYTLTLVEPGDGSTEGWRTPVLVWSPPPVRY